MLIRLGVLAVLGVCPTFAPAAPVLEVFPTGINASGNHEFSVIISPDPNLLTIDTDGDTVLDAAGMAVELAFAIDGSTVVSVQETIDWRDDNNGVLSNPGPNPFTGTLTEGIVVQPNLVHVFASLGSTGDISDLSLGAIMENNLMLVIETLGSAFTTVRWGEAASGDPVQGASLFQGTTMFSGAANGVSGAVSVPEAGAVTAIGLALSLFGAGGMRRRRA